MLFKIRLAGEEGFMCLLTHTHSVWQRSWAAALPALAHTSNSKHSHERVSGDQPRAKPAETHFLHLRLACCPRLIGRTRVWFTSQQPMGSKCQKWLRGKKWSQKQSQNHWFLKNNIILEPLCFLQEDPVLCSFNAIYCNKIAADEHL